MEASRYQFVDTLYGPGTVSGWLLTLCAIFTSWTIDKHSRAKDNVSLDLIAALLLPLIAAGHLIFLIARLPLSVGEVITSTEPMIQQYAAAMEAPLTICETFSMMSLPLAIICVSGGRPRLNIKRYAAIIATGLFSWTTENVLFVMATMKGIQPDQVTLSRPYLFMATFIVTSVWGFLFSIGIILVALMVVSIFDRKSSQRNPAIKKRHIKARRQLQLEDGISRASVKRASELFELELSRHKHMEQDVFGQAVERKNKLVMYFVLLLLTSSIMSLAFAATPKSIPYSTKFYLMPQSDSSWNDLDQIVALIGGVLVLLASLHRAYKSRVGEQPVRTRGRRRSI